MKFGIVPGTEWQLGRNVGIARKRRLLNTSFHSIVERVAGQARLYDCRRERIKAYPGSKRVRVKLIVPTQTLDLFHNGAGGYRAQFYLGIRQGEAANRHIITSLLVVLERLCGVRPKRGCCWDFIEASLRDPDAKVWIHQGSWLRWSKCTDRNLAVHRWETNGKMMILRNKNFPIWAQLTPDGEARLDLKGGCVDANFYSLGVQLKPCRSRELHDLGYT